MSKLMDSIARRDPPPPGDEDAAAWFVRTRGAMSEAEERDFIQWLAVHPSHARAYDAVCAAWNACLEFDDDKDLLVMRLEAITAISTAKHISGDGN